MSEILQRQGKQNGNTILVYQASSSDFSLLYSSEYEGYVSLMQKNFRAEVIEQTTVVTFCALPKGFYGLGFYWPEIRKFYVQVYSTTSN